LLGTYCAECRTEHNSQLSGCMSKNEACAQRPEGRDSCVCALFCQPPFAYRHAERLYVGYPPAGGCGMYVHVLCVCTHTGRARPETVDDLLACRFKLARETVTVAPVPEASPTARGKTTRDERRQKCTSAYGILFVWRVFCQSWPEGSVPLGTDRQVSLLGLDRKVTGSI
jgi:hypothetical protein